MRQIVHWSLAALTAVGLLGCKIAPANVQGKVSAADIAGEIAMETRTQAHAHYASAVIHDMNDETELALEDYYQAALGEPDNETLVLEVSRRLLLGRKNDKALELLLAAAAQPGASGEIFARLGVVYSQLGKSQEATEASRKAIRKSPASLAGYQTLFQNHLQANRGDDALGILDEAAKQRDAGVEFVTGLSELYGNYMIRFPSRRAAIEPKAIAVLERASKLEPAAVSLRLRLADGFYMLGHPEKAAPLYEQSLGQLDELPMLRDTVRAKLADIYLRAHDNKRAAAKLEDLIQQDPSNAQAYFVLGSIAYDEKRWADATENMEKAILFAPNFEQAHYDLAGAYIAAGQDSLALATLEKARAKFPPSFHMEYLFGVAFSESKAYTEAIQHFTAAEVIAQMSDTNRLTENFYFQFGAASERKGDYAQAEKYFQKAIDRAPDFAGALNYLGYMWAKRGENLEKARELIERAVKIEPKSAAYLDSMGWVLFKLGQPKPALDYLLKAVEFSDKPDAELYNHLGDIYTALNEPDKARAAWQQSIAIEPNEQVQKKLVQPAVK